MGKVFELENIIQDYAWGDRYAFNKLFGVENPNNGPQAEIWMGAHPKAPSILIDGDKRIPFSEYIANDPAGVLGEKVAKRFSNQLPFLFKVLAAGKPLSIQSHPTLEQAKIGFEKDNAAGIPLKAFNRNYKDKNHKPELIYALTKFKVLDGFRRVEVIIDLLEKIDIPMVREPLELFKLSPNRDGLIEFYTWMMNLSADEVITLTNDAVSYGQKHVGELPFDTLLQLNSFYPNDIGIMCAIMLNVVVLEPGQAMFIRAGVLHAYIEGTGMEVMANSDNVLRGGLTTKYIDVPELLSTLSFYTGDVKILPPQPAEREWETLYHTHAKEFDFSVIEPKGNTFYSGHNRSVEILFCGKGKGEMVVDDLRMGITVGQSFLVPASVEGYSISGDVTVYKACVPLDK